MEYKYVPTNPEKWVNCERGHGLCIPVDEKKPEAQKLVSQVRSVLAEKGLQGIYYDRGEPVFDPVAEATVEIQYMSARRNASGVTGRGKNAKRPDMETVYYETVTVGNFNQADYELAKKWDQKKKDGRAWTEADVRRYRESNHLTWHERQDMCHMDLVPTCINDYFTHLGGVSKRKENDEAVNAEYEAILHSNLTDSEKMEKLGACGFEIPDELWPQPTKKSNGGFCPLQIILTIGLILLLGSVIALGGLEGRGGLLTSIPAVLSPFAILLSLGFLFKGMPKFLRNRTGGIILLVVLVALFLMIPLFKKFFAMLLTLLVAYIVYTIVVCIAPTGFITIHRTDENGQTTTETRSVYGDDMAYEQLNVEIELREEGYQNIKWEP